MRYYKSLGDNMTDEQLAINAQMVVQGKGGNLSDRQQEFAQDILSAYQLSIQLANGRRQYAKGTPAPPAVES